MTEKIKLFMNLNSLRYCKSRDDLTVCRRLIQLYHHGRYNLPGHGHLNAKLARMKNILCSGMDSREERVENFQFEFNEHVHLVFTGRTEEGQKLFNELKTFLKQPGPVIWR